MKLISALVGMLTFVGVLVTLVGAWLTHIVWVVTTLAGVAGVTFGQILLMFFGTFCPPIGIIHGFLLWSGNGF